MMPKKDIYLYSMVSIISDDVDVRGWKSVIDSKRHGRSDKQKEMTCVKPPSPPLESAWDIDTIDLIDAFNEHFLASSPTPKKEFSGWSGSWID